MINGSANSNINIVTDSATVMIALTINAKALFGFRLMDYTGERCELIIDR